MKRWSLLIVLIGLLLAACTPMAVPAPAAPATPPAPAVDPPAAAPTATPLAAATVLPAVEGATPAAASKPNAAFAGVTFTYPDGLAQGIDGATVPAQAGGADDPWWVAVPQHSEISLDGYVLPGTVQAPAVVVYPAREFAAANQEAAARIAALQQLLAAQPADLNGIAANGVPDLPFLPLFNARQQVHLRVRYLSFQNGQGVSYLTQYAQGLVPVNNQELFYTFQGLTGDGKYYVAAVLPVSHASLPGSAESMAQAEREAMFANYSQYLKDTVATLAAQAGATFKPSLSDLDSMIQTLQVAAS